MEDEERIKIREKVANLSFEELLKLKEQVGSKTYNKTIYGDSVTKKSKALKRANKNRPREVSSKIRPQKLKLEIGNVVKAPKKHIPRDPRFDPLCGQYEEKIFKANYEFVNDIRAKEKEQLEEELKSCTDINRKKVIKNLLQRTNNQLREQTRKEKEELKKLQRSTEIKEKFKRGEKPQFKKKSVEKLENLIEKYEELKKSNKLQKHIEKRSKKLSKKEKRNMGKAEIQ
ncbi:ribosomal RNA processing protein 36 homolog [Diabrotica virgifera virgifera]|uniref:rRNA biogenesis protein RRP36 n=1 Tax=Diabrotica virgifera virgifera TaxID=50390 RepID=A0A6P7GA35_DIAVI|nr:ribosomal RNA processing protein 36 homolog [Diabrotica virgifera virgifera]